MPHVLLRFMAIGDANKLKLSRRVATVWVVISMAVSVFIGVIGNAMTKAGVLPTLKDPETIILVVSDLISKHGVLATIIAGLILAGILAATMSTADSQLLAASSSASQNILKEVFMKDMSEKTGMLIARITVLVIALIGVFIARNPDSSVFQIVSFAWCFLWTACSAGTVLETLHIPGCSLRNGQRRRYGICMEISDPSDGRCTWYLRTASCIPSWSCSKRNRKSPDTGSFQRSSG